MANDIQAASLFLLEDGGNLICEDADSVSAKGPTSLAEGFGRLPLHDRVQHIGATAIANQDSRIGDASRLRI